MEKEQQRGWYHCGRCGTLFDAELKGRGPCSECGRDPAFAESELAFVRASKGGGRAHSTEPSDGSVHRGAAVKPPKKSYGVAVFVVGWVVVVLLLAGVVRIFRSDTVQEDEEGPEFGLITEDQRLLSDSFAECQETLMNFLESGAPETRVRYVLDPSSVLGKMTRLRQEGGLQVSEGSPKTVIFRAIDTPQGKAIESVWEIDRGKKVEAVFRKDESGKWKIDWEDLVRYSDLSWPLYLAGVGGAEGEFRLLARKRANESGGDGDGSEIVLVEPRLGYPGRSGAQSPEVIVNRNSRFGRILNAAFERKEKGTGAYGSTVVEFDPPKMIRLRVKLRREGEVERVFTIQDIVATHWLSDDDLGIEEKAEE